MTTTRQTATLPAGITENGRMLNGDKEQTRAWAIVARYKGQWVQPVTVRCWMGRSRSASTVYASVWASGPGYRWFAGHGKAGGYGYCRHSAAVGAAISSAGIKLARSISGVGDSAVEEALQAIARALGYRVFTIVRL